MRYVFIIPTLLTIIYYLLIQATLFVIMSYTFELLANNEIIYEKRGMGYFVSPLAVEKILERKRKQFSEEYLPQFFKTMEQLSINIEQLSKLYEQYKQNKK